jgi:hypothetical protein
MKNLLVVLFLVMVAVASNKPLAPLPDRIFAANAFLVNDTGTSKSGDAREDNPSPSPPVTFIDNSRHTAEERTQERSPKAATAIEWANWALVAVGLLTFYAVWLQARETARSAESGVQAARAAEKSILLQESGMRQWVELENWRGGNVLNMGIRPGYNIFLEIYFDIVNSTPCPMTLVSYAVNADPIKWEKKTTECQYPNFLPPNKRYVVTFELPLPEDRAKAFQDGHEEIKCLVDGVIKFKDVFDKEREQPFYMVCRLKYGEPIQAGYGSVHGPT